LIDFTISLAIVRSLNWNPSTESFFANTISYSVALIYNYLMSSRWTFSSSENKKRKNVKVKFVAVNIFNLVFSSFVIAWLVGFLQTSTFSFIPFVYVQPLAKILVNGVMLVSSFILYRTLVFKD
ncbi:MAG TPA: GtrA family protein, partial [Candidatus Dojkabacteria bacterium]|nr:GtrA family protein [Candidatus Dojkabacteria bacterium]